MMGEFALLYFVDNPVYFPTFLPSIPLDTTVKARLDSKECIEIMDLCLDKMVHWTQINSERAFQTLSF